VLIPMEEAARSHTDFVRSSLDALGGSIEIGADPFEALHRICREDSSLSGRASRTAKEQASVAADIQRLSSCDSLRSLREETADGSEADEPLTEVWPHYMGSMASEMSNSPSDKKERAYSGQTDRSDKKEHDEDRYGIAGSAVRRRTAEQFQVFKAGLEELCFGRQRSRAGGRARALETMLDIRVDAVTDDFLVKRAGSKVRVRDADIPSSFLQSRDWFHLFYDDAFCPPKFFHLVVQWIACSSIHMVHFMTKLGRLSEENGFRLVRLPIAQLFPQPAPQWTWGGDQETNFDRLSLYPRRKIRLPRCEGAAKEALFAKLLDRWTQPPMNFLFIFSSPIADFKVIAVPDAAQPQRQENYQIHQRHKGWVLCDGKGLCLIALREECIYWMENRLLLLETRDAQMSEEQVGEAEVLRTEFLEVTQTVLDEVSFGGEFALR
ncbi:unnamed protein product, partial [Polarella glacialis]